MLRICREVLEGILDAARLSYPDEFFCLLGGKRDKDGYFVDEIVYIPFRQGRGFAMFSPVHIPFDARVVGSAHSHPGPAIPSAADVHSFPYAGDVHVIVGYPFTLADVRAYDARGQPIPFVVVECGQ